MFSFLCIYQTVNLYRLTPFHRPSEILGIQFPFEYHVFKRIDADGILDCSPLGPLVRIARNE